jgi:hypothetical protein
MKRRAKNLNERLFWIVTTYLVLLAVKTSATVHYVNVDGTAPTPPYNTWATAATNIQDAIDVAVAGEEVVVTNGIYQTGNAPAQFGMLWNRIAVTKPLTLHSVNGPEVTIIDGTGTTRCVYLTNNATLDGFTLTNGFAGDYGGGGGAGAYCESSNAIVFDCVITGNTTWGTGGGALGGTLSHCVITGNSAEAGGGVDHCTLTNCIVSSNSCGMSGGGAYISTLNNCIVSGNISFYGGGVHDCTLNSCIVMSNSAIWGGGSLGCTLNNCTLTRNSAGTAGGTGNSTLNNCIVFYNTATDSGPNYFEVPELPVVLNYSCTTPMPTNGIGNFTNAPRFVDLAGGDLRLQSNSPCINAGNNDYVTTSVDLDGNPRITAGVVDAGAFESPFTRPMDIAQLVLLVENSNLEAKSKQPLLVTLTAASASLDRGNTISGSNQLGAFQNKVRAQVARVDAALANQLIDATQQIIDSAKGH